MPDREAPEQAPAAADDKLSVLVAGIADKIAPEIAARTDVKTARVDVLARENVQLRERVNRLEEKLARIQKVIVG